MDANGAEVVLPGEITLEEAVRMNAEAQKREGIEKVSRDGTVVFTDEAVRIMEDEMGWGLKSFNVRDCEKVAEDLSHSYGALVERYRDKPKSLEF
jgi:hypothetical protein